MSQPRETKDLPWPYNLPIWRRFHRAQSPDGHRVALIDPAYEVSMGNPTSGLLCVTGGPHIDRCNPSFIWSDDSRYLAVPQYHHFFGRQRVLIISFEDQRVFASRQGAWYFQPESFMGGELLVKIDPWRSQRELNFHIPSDLPTQFHLQHRRFFRWPEGPWDKG